MSASSSPPNTPRRAATEAGVLAAAEALLEEGVAYADLGVERIARRRGISRTAFYFYFRDKRDLLFRLTQGVAEEFNGAAERWWAGEPGPGGLRAALEEVI